MGSTFSSISILCRTTLDSTTIQSQHRRHSLSLLQLHSTYISCYIPGSYSENKCIPPNREMFVDHPYSLILRVYLPFFSCSITCYFYSMSLHFLKRLGKFLLSIGRR